MYDVTTESGEVSVDQLRAFLRPAVPLPGYGLTHVRWQRFIGVARRDLPLAKLVEPHFDALAILSELGAAEPDPASIWAVWAAEPPFAVLTARHGAGGWTLSGAKAFCSGAALVTHALVTASTEDGPRLFAVDLSSPGIEVDDTVMPWVGTGMQRAATRTLEFDDVPAEPVGGAGAYTARPGFWFGAIGIAACWLGGALGIVDTMEGSAGRLDAHGRAHLGAVRARVAMLRFGLDGAARRIDSAEGLRDLEEAERLALVMRAAAAEAVDDVIARAGKALGPGPLAFDAGHAARVADLQVFVRQHHAERDLARLGSLGGPIV